MSHLDNIVGTQRLCAKKWEKEETGAPLVLIVYETI
jgi:hypothetical protein